MSGVYNRAQAIIVIEQPLAYYTHCMSHCINLVALCISALPDIRAVLSHVNQLNKLASNSIKFRNVLKLSWDKSNLKKPRPLYPTRWTVRVAVQLNISLRITCFYLNGYDNLFQNLPFLESFSIFQRKKAFYCYKLHVKYFFCSKN